MKTPALFALALLAVAAPVAHAAVTLSAEPLRIKVGETLTVRVDASGTGNDLSAPKVPGWDELARGSDGSSLVESQSFRIAVTASGTVQNRTHSYVWTVRPARPGTYELGPVTAAGETSSGTVTVTVETGSRAPSPIPAPSPARPGDERVDADALDLAPADAAPAAHPWVENARAHPLPWIAGACLLALAWLALRTYSFLKKMEELAPETSGDSPAVDVPAPAAHDLADGDPAAFADQAVALIRARIARAVGRDVAHLTGRELAELEPDEAKRPLAREALELADALRFGGRADAYERVRGAVRAYLA